MNDYEWNISTDDGRILLRDWCDYDLAHWYLTQHYLLRYPPDKYPEYGFYLVWREKP